MIRIAVLDDYQGAAAGSADWARLRGHAQVEFFRHALPPEDAASALADFEVVVLMRERMAFPAALIEHLPNLRLIVFTGLKHNKLDVKAAHRNGIAVCNTRGGNTQYCTAEMTWALILAAARSLPQEDAAIRRGQWQTRLGFTLHGRTLGILGLGRLGSQVARIGTAFGMRVLAWSARLDDERAAAQGARRAELQDLLAESDVVSIHLALTPETRGLINAQRLSYMRPGAVLVNTARGEIIDEAALLDCLAERRIAMAALDVFEEEPLPADHPFRSLDNVVLTPHVGYVTRETYQIFYQDVVEDIEAFIKGCPVRQVEI